MGYMLNKLLYFRIYGAKNLEREKEYMIDLMDVVIYNYIGRH